MLQVKQRISHLSPLSLTGFLLCFDRGIAITLMRFGLSPLALSHADSKFKYFLNAHTGNPMACRLYRYRASRMRMPSRLWIIFLWVILCFSPFFCSGAFAKKLCVNASDVTLSPGKFALVWRAPFVFGSANTALPPSPQQHSSEEEYSGHRPQKSSWQVFTCVLKRR